MAAPLAGRRDKSTLIAAHDSRVAGAVELMRGVLLNLDQMMGI